MGSHRIATRYAKSLLQLADEKGKLKEVQADIKSIDSILEGNRDLTMLFKSPIINADRKLAIVKKIFEGKISEILFQFLVLLIKKGREAHFHDIVNSFITQYNELQGITPVKLISAVKLDSGMVKTMISTLKAKELLKEIELQEEVDEDLLGGFVLRYGDKMIDQSVKRRLKELHNIVQDDSYIKKYS